MKLTWSDLVERAKQNDQSAFYDLYQNSYDAVYRTVKSMVRDEDAALDIVQDAFVKGFASLHALEDPEQFLPWMKRIATNKAKDWFKKRHETTFSQLADEEGNEPDFEDERTENLPEAVLDRNETARLIEEILRTLPDEQRMVIGMYYYQNMTIPEIARELEISENTVKGRLNYGKKKIRACVEDLEKKGTKLYTLAPIPFLLWLFRSQLRQLTAGTAPAAAFGKIMSAAGEAAAGTAAAGAATSAATGAAASTATSTAASAAAGTAAAGTAAAGAAVKAGVFASLGAKIAAGALAAALIGGGVGAGVYLANRGGEENETQETSETGGSEGALSRPDGSGGTSGNVLEGSSMGESSEGELPVSHEEALLRNYVEEVLLWEKGIYDLEQPAFSMDEWGTIERYTRTYDPATGGFTVDSDSRGPRSAGYEEMYAAYEAAKANEDISGLRFGKYLDWDGDGALELLVIYGEQGMSYIELFDTEGENVVSAAKLFLDPKDFGDSFSYRNLSYRYTSGGIEFTVQERAPVSEDEAEIYYRLSGDLQIVSIFAIMDFDWMNGALAAELFADGRQEALHYINGDNYRSLLADYIGNDDRHSLYDFLDTGGFPSADASPYLPIEDYFIEQHYGGNAG